MVEVGTSTASGRFTKRNYPITSGLTAGTQKQEGRQSGLSAEKSNVPQRTKAGIRNG